MDNNERNKQIVDYLNSRMDEIDSKYPDIDVRSRATKALDNIMESKGTYEEVKEKLDKSLDKMIEVYLEKEKEKKEEEVQSRDKFDNDISKINVYSPKEKLYGESYSNPMIEILKKFEEINNNGSITDKKEFFNTEIKVLLSILRQKYKASISSQIIDDIMRGELNGRKEDPLLYLMSDLFRGFDSLDYDLVKNIYDTFVNEVSVVSTDWDNNMRFCVNGNEALYLLPDNTYYSNANYFDFTKLIELFKFAKGHGKKVRLHSLLSSEYVPEALLSITNKLDNKKEFVLAFLEDYISNLVNSLSSNNIVIDQIDVISDFNSLEKKYWKDVLGDDKYYISILKLVRKYFPNTMLLINESNELLDYVCNDYVTMIKDIIDVSNKEGIKLLDGIGISSHITEFIEYYGRELKGSDIYEAMVKYASFNLPIYRTEFDYKPMEDKYNYIDVIDYVDRKCGVSGLILYGNNDLVTSKDGEYNKVHVYDDKGLLKKEYSTYIEQFVKDVMLSNDAPEVLTFNEKDDKVSNVVKWSSGDAQDANVSGESSTSTPTVIKYSTDEKGFTTSVYALVAILVILLAFVVMALLFAF